MTKSNTNPNPTTATGTAKKAAPVNQPRFMQASSKMHGVKPKHINVKLSPDFYAKWEEAKLTAEEYGFEINQTQLIRDALEDAMSVITAFIEAQDNASA